MPPLYETPDVPRLCRPRRGPQRFLNRPPPGSDPDRTNEGGRVTSKLRRVGAVLVVLGVLNGGGVAAASVLAGTASAAASCEDARLVGISGNKVVEGTEKGGFSKLDFTVSSSGCAAEGTLTYETVAYTAQKDDFVPQRGKLELRAGDLASQTITVLVVADGQQERDECFSVRVSVAAGTIKADPDEAAGIIVDDDGRKDGRTGGFICSE
jgi:Calx-beta domain